MSRVLIIESDKILADNLRSALKRAGYKVDWQREPQAAIDSADKNIPDVVVLDLVLAERSGVEFLNEFRSYPEWQHLPVIIYSEVPQGEFSFSGSFAQLGINAYHRKSHTSLNELIASVNTAAVQTLA